MSITETILVFVCIPLAVVLLIYLLVYGSSAARSRRYRPGRPFEPTPVWYVAGSSDAATASATADEITRARELTSADEALQSAEWPVAERTGQTGGASERW